ncbi:putative helicase, P-loop containing nucleoside triphosphate hydrolase, SNF2-like domain superfamily [Septoria linicola]|nr:putative helicase, P-loop containing nucleoside triphosphate hydrolase, SNF2-like domain superfamily [Septoria linicola]
MDPRQLLNPKAFAKKEKEKLKKVPNYGPQQTRKPNGASVATSQPQAPTYDPRSLLNPKAGSSKQADPAAASGAVAANDESENGVMGTARMIEALNGVTERDDVPLQKRKALTTNDDDGSDQERKKQKTQAVRSGKGGLISEHLKKERQNIAASRPGPAADSIDLTNDDDGDEVVEQGFRQVTTSKAEEDEEICLGTFDTTCNAHRVPSASAATMSKVPKDTWPMIRINYKREVGAKTKSIELVDHTNATFGHMELRAANCLCPLLDGSAVNKMRCRMYLLPRKRQKEFPGMKISMSLKMTVTVFTPRKLGPRIGQWLSKAQLFLRAPPQAFGKTVVNPHVPQVYGPVAKAGQKPTTSGYHVVRSVEEMRREADSMFDKLAKEDDMPTMDSTGGIITTELMLHQKQALKFLTTHERDDYDGDEIPSHSLWKYRAKDNGRPAWYHVITGLEVLEKPAPIQGGILADMMGLGKTLSILALIAETKEAAKTFRRTQPEDPNLDRNACSTLIICPKSVLSNWQEQIKTHTAEGSLSCYAYHGSNRMQDTSKLSKYDIVLTSYNTAAAEFSDGNGVRKALSRINWWRIVLDEGHQIRTQTTKVSKACCALHSQRRWAVTGTPVQNSLYDLGALIKFLRISPLDHPQTWSQYIMAPFKNGDTDVIQQLQLLVGSITLRRGKKTIGLKDRTEEITRLDFSESERFLYKQFATTCRTHFHNITGGGNQLRGKAYAHVLKSIGRLRAICAHGREMLTAEDMKEIEGDDQSNAIILDIGDEQGYEDENDFIPDNQAYGLFKAMQDSEMDRCQRCDRKLGKQESADGVVDLTNYSDGEYEDSPEPTTELNSADDLLGHLTPCYHLICTNCTEDHTKDCTVHLTRDRHHTCPYDDQYQRFAMKPLTKHGMRHHLEEKRQAENQPLAAKWDAASYSGPHTKVKALLHDLEESANETAALPPGEPPIRSVVFSGWTAYLDLIEYALKSRNIGYARLDGSMSIKQRTSAMDSFKSDPRIVVMLVSIKAGGQGLNFTAANKCYVMEPQFNPGVEAQAVDRVHRLGQTRPVFIKHFIMNDSVEEGILKLQRKKEALAQISMDKKKNKAEENKARMDDLRELFK